VYLPHCTERHFPCVLTCLSSTDLFLCFVIISLELFNDVVSLMFINYISLTTPSVVKIVLASNVEIVIQKGYGRKRCNLAFREFEA
jgi:hypothetical protein